MAPPIDMRLLARQMAQEGAFSVINDYVEQGKITKEVAAHWTAQFFGAFADKVKEAQTEIRKLESALQRLAAVTAQGKRTRPYNPQDPLIYSLAHELTTFDGWVISLYESDLTMISWGAPERAREKPGEFAAAMNALYAKRLEEHNINLSAPGLFKLG